MLSFVLHVFIDWNCRQVFSADILSYCSYHCFRVCMYERFYVESIVFLEDIKTIEMFYLQAQLSISQVGMTTAISGLCVTLHALCSNCCHWVNTAGILSMMLVISLVTNLLIFAVIDFVMQVYLCRFSL